MMKLIETSVRFSPGTLERLKLMAHLRSIASGRTVTWNALVRDCVEQHLLGGDATQEGDRVPTTTCQ
jgi:hypothetical protein